MHIRLYEPEPASLQAITKLLHRAYAPLAAAGMNFVAATQQVDVTESRMRAGTNFIAEDDGTIVGTITYYSTSRYPGAPSLYREPRAGIFAQFAVEPAYQRTGVGSALLSAVEDTAAGDGKIELVCDTAEPASALRSYYKRRGFREIGLHQWAHASYRSVILSKVLARVQ